MGREELPPIYRACHCFVNSSLYEGMPNVVLEAMASGLPVIASRVPGNEELVVDGENGYLCDLQSPGQFIEAMQRLIDDPALGFRLGAAGRARVVQEFSWEKIARDYAALFDGVSP